MVPNDGAAGIGQSGLAFFVLGSAADDTKMTKAAV
jgi:hypothetical protein